jgi:hypothetical protein
MGACQSRASAESKRNQTLDLRLNIDREDAAQVIRVLLLGAPESGKSTLLKQFRVSYSKGFSEAERRLFLPDMRRLAVDSMKALLARPEAFLAMPSLRVRAQPGDEEWDE